MKNALLTRTLFGLLIALSVLSFGSMSFKALAADKLTGVYAAQTISMSMPWIAQQAGLFQKYKLDFQLIYIASAPAVTAALLGGDAEVSVGGGIGIIRAFVQGATDFVFIGGVKNALTQSILAKAEIKKPEDLKGKKIGISRIGSNTHYFVIQALRQKGMEPGRDFTFIQTGGEPETFAALANGGIDAATMAPPVDAKAIAQGFHYVVYGPDLRIPYAAVILVSRRSVIAKRPQVVGQFMSAMAEAMKILHTDKEFTYKVLGKQLRVTDMKLLEASYNAEIKTLEPRLDIRLEALQAMLDEISQTDPRAKKVKPEDLIDRRYLDEMGKSGFFDQLWKR
jgi:NitT/TauT family transport system substrate-binding protein